MVDERPAQLAMVRPDLPQDRVHLGLAEALSRRKSLDDLSQHETATIFAGRPSQDAPITPEGTQLPHLLRGKLL